MFNQKEAEDFARNLIENIYANARYDLMPQYYAPDFVGHFYDELYYFEEAQKRVKALQDKICDFKIESVKVFGDFITNIANYKLTIPYSKKVFVSKQIIIWRIKNQQIQECWVIIEHEPVYYRQIDEDLSFHTRLTKLYTHKEAEDFVKRLSELITNKNQDNKLDEFFVPDFTAYYFDKAYNLNELKELIDELLSDNSKRNIEIGKVESFGDFISVGVSLIENGNNEEEYVSLKSSIILFMENRLIKVCWIMQDKMAAGNKSKSTLGNRQQSELSLYTEAGIREFFERLNQDIISDCRTDLILNYYTADFVGHLNNTKFDLEDIKARSQAIKNETKNFSYTLERVMINGNFVTASTNFSYFSKKSNVFHDGKQYNVYLMEDGKVKESWVMMDQDTESYQKLNEYIASEGKQLEIKNKTKEEFLMLLARIFEAKGLNLVVKTSQLLRECIYYYLNGYSSKEIAAELNLTHRTVEVYLAQIRDKLGCKNRYELRKKLFS